MSLSASRLFAALAILFFATSCKKKGQQPGEQAAPAEPIEAPVKYELSAERGKAEHVVVMVWDGMRPDFISEQGTPNLWALAQRGVFFANHHPAFPSTTEVNGTALATGARPEHSGIIGNKEFRPAIEPRGGVATESLSVVRKGDELTGGKYIAVPTVAETVQQAGFRTVVAGTKPVAIMQDRAEVRARKAARESVNVFEGRSAPASAIGTIVASRGSMPAKGPLPNVTQDRWTTDVLIHELWKPGVPKYSVLWMSDPDFTQHAYAPGSAQALSAIRNSDTHLGLVLAALKERGLLDRTDILVVSDHGFSTVSKVADITEPLRAAGLRATRMFKSPPRRGDILVVNTGGTALFYVAEHDTEAVAKAVRVLQQDEFSGVIFCREKIEGTFLLADAGVDSPDAPDIVVAPRWSAEKNQFGIRGVIAHDGGSKPGYGMHGSLSPFDQTNTLVAAGPDFRDGFRNEMPSGNIDIAPTVLWLMGIRPLAKQDGRVLFEALRDRAPATSKPEEMRMEASHDIGGMRWTQYLKTVSYGGSTYFIEGNGAFSPAAR